MTIGDQLFCYKLLTAFFITVDGILFVAFLVALDMAKVYRRMVLRYQEDELARLRGTLRNQIRDLGVKETDLGDRSCPD